MRVVQQGDAFAYGPIHELNQSKEIRLETRPGVWPETVYSGFEGCVSILKDHMVREDFWKFREPTTTTPREYILITSAPWMDSSQILLAWYDERHQRLCQDLRHMLTSGDSLYGMLELRTAAQTQGAFLETTTSDFITDLLPSNGEIKSMM